MRKFILALSVLACLGIVGCMSTAERQQFEQLRATPAPAPIPVDPPALSKTWQNDVISQTKGQFKDPDSLKYRFLTEPTPCSLVWNSHAKSTHGTLFGNFYCGQVAINGKNSLGGYAGEQLYIYLIGKDGSASVMKYSDVKYLFIFNPPIESW